MIELNVTQGSPEWHAARAKCFNASEAPAMKGVSQYKTRSALLHEKSTGIVPEVDAATQARFDNGHAVEAMARPLVEEIIGEELYPIVATDDTGRFLASSDGATMLCNIGFEHKAWNTSIAKIVQSGEVPESHRWQLDHQFLVFEFEKILFVVSDGTRDKMFCCWYYPQPERIDALRAGWEQFEKDLANYQHTEAAPEVTGTAPDQLPALRIEVTGMVTASNLEQFKTAAMAVFRGINTELKTDQDFADAEKAVKYCKEAEERLDAAKDHALSQTESIDVLFKTIDAIKEEARAVRLKLDKLVKSEKESRKVEIVVEASQQLRAHHDALNKRIGGYMPAFGHNLAESIKGLKSLDSMREKVSSALANAKIEANAIADRIDANRKTVEDMSLFPDFAQVCTKAPDDFAALLAMRTNARKEAEEKRLAAERERIRAEEQAKAQREAAEELARKNAEIVANNQTQFVEAKPEQVAAPVSEARPVSSVMADHVVGATEMVSHAATVKESLTDDQTIKLGEICARLGYTVGANFLASLGFVATIDRSTKLYREADFPAICRRIADHTMALAFKKAA